MKALTGFSLPPDVETLERVAPLFELAELFEVTPETLWAEAADGSLRPNGFHRAFAELARASGKPVVAHGVGLSMGTGGEADAPRRARWMARMREDHHAFRFRWYTEHLGASAPAGQSLLLPLPLPMTPSVARTVRARLALMQRVVSDVGIENNVAYFTWGPPLDEPRFLQRILARPRTHLLLDLHNLFTMAVNLGFEPEAYLERLPLDRVIEIHLSGGSWSDPRWLTSRRKMRLDAHDHAVPEPVWKLFERVALRCPRLRAVVLERMEGTVRRGDVALLAEELRRIHRTLEDLS